MENTVMGRITHEQAVSPRYGSKTDFIDFKVDATKKTVSRRVRFIGLPFEYLEFRAEKQSNPSDPKSEWKPSPFVDDHLYDRKRFTRNGYRGAEEIAKRGVCPWDVMGYKAGKKYAIVVIERGVDGEPDSVKVLNKGR